MPAGAKDGCSPLIITAILLGYYLGLGRIPACLVRLFPSLKAYFAEVAIALLAQAVYGLGGAVLAFCLSATKQVSVWLSHCALRRTNAGFIVHGFIIGAGLQLIPWLFIGGDMRPTEHPISRSAFIGISVLMMPPLEDLVLQGFLYQLYRRKFGVGGSTALLSLVAVAGHSWVLSTHMYSIITMILSEATYCLYREYTGSLLPTMACHLGVNTAYLYLSF